MPRKKDMFDIYIEEAEVEKPQKQYWNLIIDIIDS